MTKEKKIIVITVVVVMMTVLLGGLYIISDNMSRQLEGTPTASASASPSLNVTSAPSSPSESLTNPATQQSTATVTPSSTATNPVNTPTVAVTPTPTGGVATNVTLVKVSTDKDFGVYVAGEETTVTFAADAVANGSVKVFYTLRNISTSDQTTGDITIKQGERRASFAKKLNSGVYELTFRPETGSAAERMFITVLVDSDLDGGERLGMDFASTWHANAGQRAKYIKMLKAAGITHIRERIMMNEVSDDEGNVVLGGYKNEFKTMTQNGFNTIVTWHDIPDRMDSKSKGADLTKIHAHLSQLVSQLKGNISAWEIWNEQDVIHFGEMYPDQYTAYLKACAIAIADGDENALKVLGAFARIPEYSKFGNWMMENGVMDYVDVYNFHVYTFTTYGNGVLPGFDDIQKHLDFAAQYGGSIPAWQTETGTIHNEDLPLRGNDSLSQQAKYWAITGVQSAAMGVERTYPFLLIPYAGEDTLSFFALGGYAYPAYGAYATLIKMLGDCNIVGKYDKNGITGYQVKRQDNKNMSVFWSLEGKKTLEFASSKSVTVTDMYGYQTVVEPVGGKVTVTISDAPVYVNAPASLFTAFSPTTDKATVKQLSQAQRVVLQPNFPLANAPDMPTLQTVTTGYEGVNSGYRFNKGETAEVTVKVYNFNSKNINGTVKMTLPSGWSSTAASASVSVDANSSATVTFRITAPGNINKDTFDKITFTGDFGLGANTVSVSRVSGR